METSKHKKRYWWMLIIGALCVSIMGGQVVATLIENKDPEWLQWMVAIFCSGASLAMVIDGLWLIVSSVTGTLKEDKILREKLKKEKE
jgi:uncharacterized membrane protein YfcA